jgi:hypothetical protein
MINIEKYIEEVERRWRSRTPATNVLDIEPESRVNRAEMVLWARQKGYTLPIRDDEFDRAVFSLFKRLRKEFPNEKWSKRNCATIQRMKEV